MQVKVEIETTIMLQLSIAEATKLQGLLQNSTKYSPEDSHKFLKELFYALKEKTNATV